MLFRSVYSLPSIAIVGDGSQITLVALNVKDPQSETYSIPFGATDKTFKVIFSVDNLVKLMAVDYRLDISSAKLAHFVSDEIEYFVAVETTSTF